VNLLALMGVCRENLGPEDEKEADEMIRQLCRRIHLRSGVPYRDLIAAIPRLAAGDVLDEHPNRLRWGSYGEPMRELCHIISPLNKMDEDGYTARLWRNWPIFRVVFGAVFGGKADSRKRAGKPKATPAPATPPANPTALPPVETESSEATIGQYVTLDQMAATVHRSKRTLEKWKTRKKNPLPEPDVEGGGGEGCEVELADHSTLA
jgi:hypothetical protein